LQNYSNKLYQDGLYGDGKLNGDFPSSYKFAQPQLCGTTKTKVGISKSIKGPPHASTTGRCMWGPLHL